jgi:threonine/homoserine/homoserine lactone efflux protein
MELSVLGMFAAALLVSAGSPGPSIAALVARVLSRGLGSVVPFLVAMWFGEALWLIAAVLGLGFIAQQFYLVFSLIKYLGIAYLVYLAWKMWHAPIHLNDRDTLPDSSPVQQFLTGFALTIGNPKIMVFYLALLPSLINLEQVTMIGLAQLVAVALLVMMFVDLTWAFAAAWARQWFRSPRAMKITNRSSAIAMGGAAAVLASR